MPDLRLELEARVRGVVAGMDEAGRGPLVGSVVAAACIIPDSAPLDLLDLLDDSKKLSKKRRNAAEAMILATCDIGIGVASVEEIGRINILQATFLAMRRAAAALKTRPCLVLVDGNKTPGIEGVEEIAVIKGDSISASIAAASIIAKEYRDREVMGPLSKLYPQFGFDRNAGYGTPEHLDALQRFGPTPEHRVTFAPVRETIAARAA
jgi:ribonuclease HII